MTPPELIKTKLKVSEAPDLSQAAGGGCGGRPRGEERKEGTLGLVSSEPHLPDGGGGGPLGFSRKLLRHPQLLSPQGTDLPLAPSSQRRLPRSSGPHLSQSWSLGGGPGLGTLYRGGVWEAMAWSPTSAEGKGSGVPSS